MYYVIFGLLGAALLCADQWVKAWTVAHLELWETAPLFPGFLELMRVHNYGAAWSSLSGQRWLLLGVTGVIVLAVLWALIRKIVRHPLGILACCLIISGGIGNIIDRLRLGYVVDMLHFQLPHLQRGGYLHCVRSHSGGCLLCADLRKTRWEETEWSH